jgi:iron(III) transport system substrate-binding protein
MSMHVLKKTGTMLRATALGCAAGLCMAWAPVAGAEDARPFDLNALIEAAKKEPPITVYAVTGKIVEQAEAFTKKYGVKATGKKVGAAAQVELAIRESKANNIVGDVSLAMDLASAQAEVLSAGIMESWTPPDIASSIPEGMRNPLVVVSDPLVWTYNTQKNSKCPVTNVWQLTEPAWTAKVAMQDPLETPSYIDWLNQMETHWDADMAKAYEANFGKKLVTSEGSATKAWVKAFLQNKPLLSDSATVANAAGAPDQANPFFAMSSTAKYRDNVTLGLKLGICANMKPFAGWLYPAFGLIAKGTKSPNAARLFVRYLMTEEGISSQTVDGKISSSSKVPLHADEPSGIAEFLNQLMPYNTATADQDFDKRQDWQDFWRVNYKK